MTAVNSVESMLRREEDDIPHAYQDHLGYWTIGVGILIDKRKGGGLRPEESEFLLKNRVRILTLELQKRWPWIVRLSEPRQAVLIGMAYQMGIAGLAGFVNTLRNIEAGWYDKASKGMLQSLWAKQTPERAARMAEQMRTGVWQQ